MNTTMRTKPCPVCHKSRIINGTLEQITDIRAGRPASQVFPGLPVSEQKSIDFGVCPGCKMEAIFKCPDCKLEKTYPDDSIENLCPACEDKDKSVEMNRI